MPLKGGHCSPETKAKLSRALTTDVMDRFLSKVNKEDAHGCWIWTRATFSNGYGVFRFPSRNARAHRTAWELFRGPVPPGIRVLHRCDRPACVNPDHLFLGTDQDNVDDKYRKGRGIVGETSRRAKLTNSQVALAKAMILSGDIYDDVSDETGISKHTLYGIKSGHCWRRVPPAYRRDDEQDAVIAAAKELT